MQEEFDLELGYLLDVPDNLINVHVIAEIVIEADRDYDDFDAWCDEYSVWDVNDQFIPNSDLPKNVKTFIQKQIDNRIQSNLYDYQVDMVSGLADSLYDDLRESFD